MNVETLIWNHHSYIHILVRLDIVPIHNNSGLQDKMATNSGDQAICSIERIYKFSVYKNWLTIFSNGNLRVIFGRMLSIAIVFKQVVIITCNPLIDYTKRTVPFWWGHLQCIPPTAYHIPKFAPESHFDVNTFSDHKLLLQSRVFCGDRNICLKIRIPYLTIMNNIIEEKCSPTEDENMATKGNKKKYYYTKKSSE
ncbi:hypothetical protein AGLY_005221 [Aphis glycines]|uniref:Uncharacterized protein n=1 Tax=Aphis glycines TaxID=307491 RepID=A0A6G0TYE8_APHGL|nr:hypothetical protein AGLY_005221 [Aphis glycines]